MKLWFMAQINEHILLPALGVFERDLLEPLVCDTAKQQSPLISVGATPGPLHFQNSVFLTAYAYKIQICLHA